MAVDLPTITMSFLYLTLYVGKTIQLRKPEKCPFCGRVFRSGKLKRHIRTVHNDKTSFKCDFGNCKYGSKDKYSLKHHFETAHKG